MRKLLFLLGILALLGTGAAWFVLRYRVEPMPVSMHSSLPVPHIGKGTVVLTMPNGNLVGMVGQYTNELTAYLRFEYLQSLEDLSGSAILLRTREEEDHPVYLLYVVLPNDLLEGGNRLAALQIEGFIHGFSLESPPSSQLQDWEQQTRVFDAAYRRPVRQRLLEVPRDQLTSSVAQFILFKVRTDRRVRKQLTPIENVLSRNDALRFASDMIDVAKFYNIPLSMLLGIGAMENNYMSIRGDLKHASWKHHAQRGDLVLKRRYGKVLVRNYSQGAWQITRETLRYAHALYTHDTRDYRLLPERLRPPKHLDLDNVTADALTTYAGLLLRNLLDAFDGNVTLAAGAYNGGTGRPNLKYAEGVTLVADYARRVLGSAVHTNSSRIAKIPLKNIAVAKATIAPTHPHR
jgi:hypothetical protein